MPDEPPTTEATDDASPIDEETLSLFWSADGMRDAYERLIIASSLPVVGAALPEAPENDPLRVLHWVHRSPRSVGLDVLEERVSLGRLLECLMESTGATITVVVLATGQMGILAAILESGNNARVLKPDGTEVVIRRTAVHAAITRLMSLQNEPLKYIYEGLPGGEAALQSLLREDALGASAPFFFRFELDASHSIWTQLSSTGAWQALGLNFFLSTIQVIASIGALWTLGSSAIDGRIDSGRVLGWALLSLSDVPLQYMATRALVTFSTAFATVVKKRLLEGTFFVNEKEVRSQGFGALLARTNEANVVEQLSLTEISGAVLAVLQVIASIFLFVRGALPAGVIIVLLAFVIATGLLVRRMVSTYASSYRRRLELTDDLVDKILGHRTRAVQQSPRERHGSEDLDLNEYTRVSRELDSARTIASIFPRAWLTCSSLVVLLAFMLRAPVTTMVFSGLGIVLVYRALDSFFPAIDRLVELKTAWDGIEGLVSAGRQRERPSRDMDLDVDEGNLPTTLSVSSVSFAHRAAGRPILSNTDFKVQSGEKILLEGVSGSGKTTLLKLIAGEYPASGGVILVGGTDRFSVSEKEWRQRVASAPQFHENYVFANTFAFNLDPWGQVDFASAEAIAICKELGLGPLVEKMPRGYGQLLGETGWQLSHGEKSRLYIARALLQKSDLFLFDENFGALDPETLNQALECVRRRAKTLIVIAHT